jgi:hypothetical protein
MIQLGRPGRRWEYSITVGVEELEWGVEWTGFIQLKVITRGGML